MVHFYNNVMIRARKKGFTTSKEELLKIAQQLGCEIDDATSTQINQALEILSSRMVVVSPNSSEDIHTQETKIQPDTAALVRQELSQTGVSLTLAQQEQITAISNRIINNQTSESLSQIEVIRQSIAEYLEAQRALGKSLLRGLAEDIKEKQATFEEDMQNELLAVLGETTTEQQQIDGRFKKKCMNLAFAFTEAKAALQ